jgi:hypothetical protein
VFKTWALKRNGTSGYRKWDRKEYEHGDWGTWHYVNGSAGADVTTFANKENRKIMDAFGKNANGSGHIALVWSLGTTQGQDTFIEAFNEQGGVTRGTRNYRSDAQYVGVRRKGMDERLWR